MNEHTFTTSKSPVDREMEFLSLVYGAFAMVGIVGVAILS